MSLNSSSDPKVLTAEAHSLLNQESYEPALRCFKQVAVQHQSADNFVSQAVCLIYLHRAEEALQTCDAALVLDSGHKQAWLFRGVALHRLGRYRDAYACYSVALDDQRISWYGQLHRYARICIRSLSSLINVLKQRLAQLRIH